MRRLCFWIAAWLALGLSACTTLRPAPPLDTAKACADWRWIAIKKSPDAQCPEVRGWTVSPLFPQVASVQKLSDDYCAQHAEGKVPDQQVIRELNRFCVYEATDKFLEKHPFPPAASAELVRFDQDCAALSTSGSGEKTRVLKNWASYSDHLLAQAGALNEPLKIDNPYGVRLAILDTEKTSEKIPGDRPEYSWHGYTLAHIARHLVCFSDNCAAQITTQLALPIIDFNPKSKKFTKSGAGGYIGMQSDIATAITTEVKAWLSARRQGNAEQHLVLNLSLAWDGRLFGGLDEQQIAEMRAGTQGVYWALQYAAGFDALVLAAAGNQKAEPCDNFGPLLPAAWERGGPPDCREWLQNAPRPLVYAVGGVSSNSQPLVNSRFRGTPRRVAYGENAVVASFEPNKRTGIMTGSSVATTVVSSIAAVVWSYFPEKNSREIMQILDGSGEDLHRQADFWSSPDFTGSTARPTVHKLSLCNALKAACAQPTSVPCPITIQNLKCVPWPEPSPMPPPLDTTNWVPDSCQPWAYPQPESPPCLSCGPPGG